MCNVACGNYELNVSQLQQGAWVKLTLPTHDPLIPYSNYVKYFVVLYRRCSGADGGKNFEAIEVAWGAAPMCLQEALQKCPLTLRKKHLSFSEQERSFLPECDGTCGKHHTWDQDIDYRQCLVRVHLWSKCVMLLGGIMNLMQVNSNKEFNELYTGRAH